MDSSKHGWEQRKRKFELEELGLNAQYVSGKLNLGSWTSLSTRLPLWYKDQIITKHLTELYLKTLIDRQNIWEAKTVKLVPPTLVTFTYTNLLFVSIELLFVFSRQVRSVALMETEYSWESHRWLESHTAFNVRQAQITVVFFIDKFKKPDNTRWLINIS